MNNIEDLKRKLEPYDNPDGITRLPTTDFHLWLRHYEAAVNADLASRYATRPMVVKL